MLRRRYNRKLLPDQHIIPAIVAALILIAVLAIFFLYFEREKPTVTIAGEVDRLGTRKDYTLEVADRKSGLRQVEIKVRQGEMEKRVKVEFLERRSNLPSAGPGSYETTFTLETGELGLQDGPAELVIEARDFSLWSFLRGNLTSRVYSLTVDTKPPGVSRTTSSRYIEPGGSGIVIYSVSRDAVSHGVRLNGFFHPGNPVPGEKDRYAALIGLPYDAEKIENLWVEARDKAGNVGKSRFGVILKEVAAKHDRINISDSFLDWKLPEFSSYLEEVEGSRIDKFLHINETVRGKNNSRIRKLCGDPDDERHWQGCFLRMSGKRMSRFAERRSYYYEGKAIDKQVHLGTDLASYRHADVEAANHGRVEFTGDMGIYGNTIILDHGLGVFSLYAHLSDMAVSPGDQVEKGRKIGVTDTTGMAGGDHLHFSMLINGIFVNPLEWWDQRWIEDNILGYLQ